ncbi:uncharacterized protein [Typha angustifolia]|uniref:uncharacterized protein isoform X4 n=1 Tax=Typha angustifolia TaxID=59011 RepID=UPI003C2CEB68
MPPAEEGRVSGEEAGRENISDLLPLGLVRAQLIPPSPNRRESAIDFLPDFGGASWIAYGAASLLVISHFPSPLSSHEIKVGPLFRQVIEMPPPSDATAAASVNAVSWCPAIPSEGEIAAAAGSCIWMYSPVPARDGSGSFCWKQAATIVETFIVDTIEWTGSGDGLIVAGVDVVLWVRKETSWEMTWRSRAKVPQVLVSATWLAEGPVATGAHAVAHCNGTNPAAASSLSGEEYKHVFVYLSDEKSGLTKIQLCHPQPVSMIQWRPFARAQSEKDASHVWRNVLLTCCLDGTVRLWSENEIGRSRKIGKDAHDQRNTRRSFNVIAVIEINKCSKGMLGKDIFVKWAIEFGGVISKGEGDRYDLWPSDFEQHQVGKCEWLIGIESNFSVTFWAIHCLDDVSPARFPRVTLWRKQHLMDLKTSVINYDSSNSEGQPIFIKVVASRRLCFGSPDVCSLLQLLPDNSIIWSMLYSPILDCTDDVVSSKNITEKCLFSFAGEVLNQDGHTGTIRQVCVHPYSCEIEIAASLDSDGLLLLWSISTFSTFTWNLQTALHPLWRLLGRIYLRDLSTDSGYSCLSWAPSILDDNRFLLLGSENGIDCFIIRVPGTGENVLCQKILTIPYGVGKNGEGPPDHVFSTPVTSNCGKSLLSSSFLLFCIWKKKFQALSWKVVLHSGDPNEGYCGCGFDAKSILFEGKMYFAKVYLGSSVFPSPQESDQTTSSAIVSMNKSVISVEQYVSSYNGSGNSSPSYHLVTGCFDGTLKLWKMSCEENAFHSEKEILCWDLVGMFTAHQGAVTSISLSSCGFKIASASTSPQTNITSLHVWEPVCLMGGGSFLFEDAIILQDTVVGLSWVSLGNGQLLLGVCLPNELRIYCHRRPSGQNLVHSKKSKEMHFWNYIAVAHSYPVIKEFFWAPKVTPVLVHEKHFSLFSQWQFRTDLKDSVDHSITYSAAVGEYFPSITNIEGTNIYKAGSSKGSNNGKNGCADCSSCPVTSNQHNDPNFMNRLFNLMDIVDRLGGPLAVYHPQALIQHLYSGNWKRAQIVLQHLAESIRTSETSTTNMECTGFGESGHIIPEIHLSDYFMDTTSTNFSYKGLQWGENSTTRVSDFHFHANVLHDVASQKSEVTGFAHTLNKCLDVAAITDIERMQILVIVDLLVEISDLSRASAYKTLDEPGRRFWVAVEFQRRYFLRKFGNSAAAEGFLVDSASVAWALQSDCQDDLLKSLLSLEPTWPEMRNLGIGLWYTNVTQLRTKMEKLARLQYLKNKDPKECALLYLALNRRQVLASLFKISKDEKDKPLFGFLSRNFQEEKNKAAALKNAYVLMGRHQLELAVAFFLLGNDPSSAVTVCAKNLGDEQLALIICRLVEGYGGPLEHHLISNVLLPNAIEKEDYWLSSILEWTLGNFSQSVQKLFDSQYKTQISQSAAMGNHAVCSDPKIGQYCVYLSTKNNFKNSVGDALAAKLSKLSTSLVASALKRIGLPLEALECLSSSLSIDTKDQGSSLHVGDQIFHKILNPFPGAAPNWLSRDVAANFELNAKLNMASEYMSHLLIGHPQWPDVGLTREVSHKEHDDLQIGGLKHDVEIAISVLRKKFSLKLLDLAGMILVFACNKGFPFLAYLLFHANRSPENEADNCGLDASSSTSSYTLFRLLLKANEEICYFVARYVVSCHFTDSTLKLDLRLSSLLLSGNEDKESLFSLLWKISVSPQDICASLANESVNYFPHNGQKLSMSWKDMEKSASVDYEIGASENSRAENEFSSTSPSYGTGRRFIGRASEADDLLETRRKHPSAEKETSYFHNPRELMKRNGELFEAICFNSINEHQVAVASNKKGLLFLNWNGEQHFKRQTEFAEYIWSECDWPQDGWAGSESTPIPTYVSPGIGLGSKRGAHLGLGGATTGLGSLARPRRDLMGGGAFGIPGYAGIGASGLGWGEQEDFEEYVDPPATVENVHSRALSHHPTRPFFLVGSSNTHVYLWEFGKDRALATYGVLPAANVPPPYALASVSSLQFDYYGHRFATAALDGTICTWQLEVGGRSNIHPLDSSLCFNNHASDVAYVSGSGSILAAAGCSSNGANVVIWDTLAPPPTCQASVFCHEGGARSLSVFDNDIGSGSISPLIVTGGKNGDVGLHDFRYIATGKTKRHKNCNELDLKSTVIHDTTYGAPNIGDSSNGMLWYIPKAHLGSVTRISTIPNTSLFLTGSKDGDVKLWDARRSQLVFHWQKLHDRHTFFQPNSRGFGGVVRAAVTDIQVLSHGFLTCGGDGSVKLIELQ